MYFLDNVQPILFIHIFLGEELQWTQVITEKKKQNKYLIFSSSNDCCYYQSSF